MFCNSLIAIATMVGSTATVVKSSERCVLRSKPPVVLDHCRTSTYRLLERGAFNDASTSNCFARSVLRSGPHASMPSSLWRSFDKLHGRGRVPLSTDIIISASDLHSFFDNKVAGVPLYVLPLLTRIHRLSPLPQSGVWCGCFQLSHLLMSWRQ